MKDLDLGRIRLSAIDRLGIRSGEEQDHLRRCGHIRSADRERRQRFPGRARTKQCSWSRFWAIWKGFSKPPIIRRAGQGGKQCES
jgi:hypothetical protein